MLSDNLFLVLYISIFFKDELRNSRKSFYLENYLFLLLEKSEKKNKKEIIIN